MCSVFSCLSLTVCVCEREAKRVGGKESQKRVTFCFKNFNPSSPGKDIKKSPYIFYVFFLILNWTFIIYLLV